MDCVVALLLAMTTGSTARFQRLVDLGPKHGVDIFRRDRTDQFVDDGAFAPDDEGFRHAIDTPFDRGAAVGIDADNAKRIAIAAEKAPGIVGGILVVDAHDLQPAVMAEFGQKRRLVVARHTPRRPDVDDADLALERGRIEPRHLRAIVDEPIERRQRGLRRRMADQGGWNSRRVAVAEPEPEDRGEAGEGQQRHRHQPARGSLACIGCRGFAHLISVALRPERLTTPPASSSPRMRFWRRWSIPIQAISNATTAATTK